MAQELPKSAKKLCLTVMDVKEVNGEVLGKDAVPGYHVKCPNCKKYDKFISKSQGLTKASNHWKSCVKDQALKIYEECLSRKNNTTDDVRTDEASSKSQKQFKSNY